MHAIDSKEVSAQVTKICLSEPFQRSERLASFLRYIVDEVLQKKGDSIKAWTIAVEVFNRPNHFDAQTDSIVRVYGGKLRRALNNYYSLNGKEDPIVISIPKGGYVPEICRRNEATKEILLHDDNYHQVADNLPNPTIAIVMFEPLGEEEQYGYFSTGITNEIMVALTKFSPLQVIGPLINTKEDGLDNSVILQKYGARFVLQGWIQIHKNRLRLSTALHDVSSATKLWAKTFKFDLDEASLFDIEDEIVGEVAAIIGDGLGLIFRKLYNETYHNHIMVNDVTAAVLAYNHAWMTHDPQDWERAFHIVNEVYAVHPSNALLNALLSNILYADLLHELNLLPDSKEKMEKLAYKAMALDPNLQVARYNFVPQSAFFGRIDTCIDEAKKVVAMNPNHSRILSGCAAALVTVGAYELGLEYIERAKKLNPHYPGWYHFVNYLVHFAHEQYDEAWLEAKKIHVEGLFLHPLFRATILGKLNRKAEAESYVKELLEIKPEFLNRPLEYIRLLFVTDQHVEMVWDGLCRAGIKDY